MNKYFKIILDHDKVNEIFGDLTPFNLKKEIKQLSNEEKKFIIKYTADELCLPEKPPSRCILTRNNNLYIIKIRCPKLTNNKGKSYGYRIIILVDEIRCIGIILSILDKSKSSDLSQYEKNKLKILINACFSKENDNYG